MTIGWLAAIAAITYGSRVLAMALLPSTPERVRRILARVPAPLFAGLAALSVTGPEGLGAPAPTLGAMAAALLVWPLRSLPAALIAGVVGYGVASLLV